MVAWVHSRLKIIKQSTHCSSAIAIRAESMSSCTLSPSSSVALMISIFLCQLPPNAPSILVPLVRLNRPYIHTDRHTSIESKLITMENYTQHNRCMHIHCSCILNHTQCMCTLLHVHRSFNKLRIIHEPRDLSYIQKGHSAYMHIT